MDALPAVFFKCLSCNSHCCDAICCLFLFHGFEWVGQFHSTALLLAARLGYKDICAILLDKGADLNLADRVSE